MNPRIPLQKHFFYRSEIGKTWQLSTIAELLEKFKDDYDLMVQLSKDLKCEYCEGDLHWIYKLQCPRKVYKEGYDFKSLYEALVYALEIGNLNKGFLDLYDEYVAFQNNKDYIQKWEQKIGVLDRAHNNLFVQMSYRLIPTYDDLGKLIYIDPIADGKYGCQVHISPDSFTGVVKIYKLLQEKYPDGTLYFTMCN